jgi:hypothetical protein
MVTKKTTAKKLPAATSAKRNPDAFEVVASKDTTSQALAKLATGSVLSAVTLKRYSGAGNALEIPDLVVEMRKAGDEVVGGNMGRVERMLTNQALTLDAIFNDMAQRSGRQDQFKGIEVLMRLALKAQAQARSTAEALALLKNPMPYIRQANIANGPQQVNNGGAAGANPDPEQSAQERTHAEKSVSEQNKLLEADHGNYLDTRAQGAASRANPHMETVG